MPVGLLAAVAFAIGLSLGRPAAVQAETQSTDDTDCDGIPDLNEMVLGTSPVDEDTDGDRRGDSLHAGSLLSTPRCGVRLLVRGMHEDPARRPPRTTSGREPSKPTAGRTAMTGTGPS